MDHVKGHTASAPFDNTICLASSSDVPRQAMEEIEKQLDTLGVEKWRGLDLRDLNIHLRPHKDLAQNAYLYWFHQNPVRAKLTRLTCGSWRSRIQNWCHKLRSHGIEYQTTYAAFKNWVSVQARLDPTSEAKYQLLEEEIIGPFMEFQQDELKRRTETMDRYKAKIAMETEIPIVVSSGEDSDVEFLGYGASSNKQHNLDSSYKRREYAATRGTTVQPESVMQKFNTKKAASSKNGSWEYICKRCHKPGHHLTDCPTNLDPNYDTKPADQYRCAICGAIEEHYGTLCPKNTAPWSLNQLRLKNGIRTIDGQRGIDDSYPASHDDSIPMRTVTGKRSRETAPDSTRPDNYRLTDIEHDVNYIHESRRALVCHTQAWQQSSEDDRKIGRRVKGHDSSLTPKRLRRQKEEGEIEEERAGNHSIGYHQKAGRNKRQRLDRSARSDSPEEPRSSYGNHTRSPKLLSVARHDNENNGRLSYWDEEYGSPEIGNRSSEADEPRVNMRRDSNIERAFPYCDPVWEHEMATFNVDNFLDSISEYLAAYEQAESRRSMKALTILGDGPNEATRIRDASKELPENKSGALWRR